jgi:DNA-binding beta-propeller fold protein YncE
MMRFKYLLLASLFIAILSACATQPAPPLGFSMPAVSGQPDEGNIWPPPPAVPRYMYLGDLRGESNRPQGSTQQKSLLSRFFSALVGLGSKAIPVTDLFRPQHGVVDKNGRIYVTDPGRQAVFVFNEVTSDFSVWNKNGQDIPFISPVSITLIDDEVLVTDSDQGLVFVFNQLGEIIDRIGKGKLIRPTGITYSTSTKRIYVSDTDDHNIKVFNRAGELLETIGSKGAGAGQFNRPTYLKYNKNKLYIADSLNARVQVINLLDNSFEVIGHRGLYIGNFSRPKGIALDSDGNIYITESYYDHLLIFNPEGKLLMSIGGSGQDAGQFSQPTGVWIDHNDRLFVSDMLNSRVSIFQYLGGS